MALDAGTQLRRGVAEYCVLGLLSREPMYGWQLSAALSGEGLIASIGTLYPLLSRLRARGLISAFEERSDSGPTRKYYRLTAEGEAQLEAFRGQWAPFVRTVSEIIERGTP